MPIHILPPEVASQIAAGEVVERPMSVVKELVENSLDAGASQVTIHIRDAGQRLIEVTDNGVGIKPDEILLAVERFATSKLEKSDDLFHIRTLGFRGEALASIGSVSRLTILSRQSEQPVGCSLTVEGGKNGKLEQIGSPAGTTVRVEDLFYNVPARLKFLKKQTTEKQQVNALVTRYALAYPQVRFQLLMDDKPVLQTSGNGKHLEALASLYGIETARQMLAVSLDEPTLKITGFTSPVGISRGNRKEITFFINGRWVSDMGLNSALIQAYHTYLMIGRYPLSILFIEVNPEDVDVNVHPAKAEVRFKQPEQLFSLVQRAVRRALMAYTSAPLVNIPTWKTTLPANNQTAQPVISGLDWKMRADENNPIETGSQPQIGLDAYSNNRENGPDLPSGELPILRILGQLGNTYLAAEGPDGLYLVDQHAAHERILYEKMMRQFRTEIISQTLLHAITLQLPPRSARLLNEQLVVVNRLGFQVEEFGMDSFRINAIPALLADMDPGTALKVLVEDFEEDETPLQARIEDKIVARICKRAAVKGGQSLTPQEQNALLRDLEACQSPRTCPHGRPTMIHLSVDLLERQFGRRGSR